MSSAAQPRGAEASATGSLIAPTGTKYRSGGGLVQMHYSASARHKDASLSTFRPATLAHRLSYRSKVVTFSSSQPRTSLRRAQSGMSSELLPERASSTAATRNFLTKTMSRMHASLVWIDGRPALIDHASTHGTFVARVRATQSPDHIWAARVPNAASARLEPEKPFVLEDGDLVTLGKDVMRDGKLHQAVRAFVSVQTAPEQISAAEGAAASARADPSLRSFFTATKASASSAAATAKNPTRRYGLDSIEVSEDEWAEETDPAGEAVVRQASVSAGSDVVSVASDLVNVDARGSSRSRSPSQSDGLSGDEESQPQIGAAVLSFDEAGRLKVSLVKAEPLSEPGLSDNDLTGSETASALNDAIVKSEKATSAVKGSASKKALVDPLFGTSRRLVLSRYMGELPEQKRVVHSKAGNDGAARLGDDTIDDGNAPADISFVRADAESDAALDEEDQQSSAMEAESASEAELDDELEDEELDEELEEEDLDDEHDDFDANALDADELYANDVASEQPDDCEEPAQYDEEGYDVEELADEDAAAEADAVAENDGEDLPAAESESADDDAAAAEEEPFDDQIWRELKPPCDCDACLSDHECPEDEQEEEAEEEEEAVVDNGSEVSEEDVASCDCSECADALSDSEEEDDEQSEEDAADEPGTPESSKHDCQSAADDAYAAHLAAGGARDVLHEAQLATWRDDDIASLAAWKSMRKHARKSAQQQRTHEAEELSGDAEVEPNAGASVAQEDASVEAPSLDTPRMDTPSLNTSSLATPKPEVSETSCPAVQAGVKRSLDDMENEESAAPEASGNSPASDNSEVVPQASATAAASDVAARPSKRARRIAAARNFAAGAAIGALGTFLGLARLGRSYE